MKIRRMAFSHLSSILELQGFTFPILEKAMGEDTIAVYQINGETQKAIRVRHYSPIDYVMHFPSNLAANLAGNKTIIRRGIVNHEITFHIDT